MSFLIILAVLLLVVLFVTAPLRRTVKQPATDDGAADVVHAAAIADLEAAREAKLREITDADLDHRMGKLSDEDHRELDGSLRGEAVEILNRLDALREDAHEPAV